MEASSTGGVESFRHCFLNRNHLRIVSVAVRIKIVTTDPHHTLIIVHSPPEGELTPGFRSNGLGLQEGCTVRRRQKEMPIHFTYINRSFSGFWLGVKPDFPGKNVAQISDNLLLNFVRSQTAVKVMGRTAEFEHSVTNIYSSSVSIQYSVLSNFIILLTYSIDHSDLVKVINSTRA